MTTVERDRIARKIVTEIMKDLLEKTELGLQADNWDDGDDDDKKDATKRWELIVKRYLPVDGKSNDTDRRIN